MNYVSIKVLAILLLLGQLNNMIEIQEKHSGYLG